MGNRIDKELVDEIRIIWRKSGITLKYLRKKYSLSTDTLYQIVKNTRQSNDINKNGMRVVRDFKPKGQDDRIGGYKGGGYKGNSSGYKKPYDNNKKPYYKRNDSGPSSYSNDANKPAATS